VGKIVINIDTLSDKGVLLARLRILTYELYNECRKMLRADSGGYDQMLAERERFTEAMNRSLVEAFVLGMEHARDALPSGDQQVDDMRHALELDRREAVGPGADISRDEIEEVIRGADATWARNMTTMEEYKRRAGILQRLYAKLVNITE
jgi:hypothetical protein